MIEKQDTIAATMRHLMATGPSITDYPNYKALNDAVGAAHGLPEGKCQALAGEKAWAWYADTATGRWRKATPEEVESRRQKAATKAHGTRKAKVLSDADRAALDAQVAALEAVDNPALAPLLEDLRGKQAADDAARKGSLKDRLQGLVDRLGLETVVEVLELCEAGAAAAEAPETPEAETPEDTEDTEDTEDA